MGKSVFFKTIFVFQSSGQRGDYEAKSRIHEMKEVGEVQSAGFDHILIIMITVFAKIDCTSTGRYKV